MVREGGRDSKRQRRNNEKMRWKFWKNESEIVRETEENGERKRVKLWEKESEIVSERGRNSERKKEIVRENNGIERERKVTSERVQRI